MSTGEVLIVTLAGFAFGAAAGILFAPDKGSKSRKQIMDKGDDYVHELKSKFEELRESFTETMENTKRDAEGLVDQGKTKYKDAKKEMKKASSNLKRDDAAGITNTTL